MGAGGLTDTPANLHGNVADDSVTVNQVVSPDYMWNLYIAHVALALALETTQRLPWSIGSYTGSSLRDLFDSSRMAWNVPNGNFSMGTYAQFVPALRADNRPKTAFAPPKWTYPFLVQAGLIGNTRRDTIGRVLEWMRQNLVHFFGADTYGTCDAVWQYRGYPPLSRMVNRNDRSKQPRSFNAALDARLPRQRRVPQRRSEGRQHSSSTGLDRRTRTRLFRFRGRVLGSRRRPPLQPECEKLDRTGSQSTD